MTIVMHKTCFRDGSRRIDGGKFQLPAVDRRNDETVVSRAVGK
jgi:hypothetical protein